MLYQLTSDIASLTLWSRKSWHYPLGSTWMLGIDIVLTIARCCCHFRWCHWSYFDITYCIDIVHFDIAWSYFDFDIAWSYFDIASGIDIVPTIARCCCFGIASGIDIVLTIERCCYHCRWTFFFLPPPEPVWCSLDKDGVALQQYPWQWR